MAKRDTSTKRLKNRSEPVDEEAETPAWVTWLTVGMGVALLVSILTVTFKLAAGEPQPWVVNLLITTVAAIVGIGVGTMASPLGEEDAAQLLTISKSVSLFVGGWVASKVDYVIALTITDKQDLHGMLIPRTLLFVAMLGLSAIATYVIRTYGGIVFTVTTTETTTEE